MRGAVRGERRGKEEAGKKKEILGGRRVEGEAAHYHFLFFFSFLWVRCAPFPPYMCRTCWWESTFTCASFSNLVDTPQWLLRVRAQEGHEGQGG